MALLTIAMFFGQCSVGIQNDYLDRERDAGRGDKPIPSGMVRRRAAAAASILTGILFVVLHAGLGLMVLALGLAAIGSGYGYNLWLKHTPFGALAYVAGFSLLALWVWTGTNALRLSLLWTFVFGLPVLVGLALANAIPDIDRDRATQVRNLATLLGPVRAVRVMFLLAAVSLCAEMVGIVLLAENRAPALVATPVAAALLAGVSAASLSHRYRLVFQTYGVMTAVLAAGWVASA